MKKNLFVLILAALIVSSCSTFKVDMVGDPDAVKNFKDIAILNVYLCPPYIPYFFLMELDAGIYKSNYDEIYGDINIFNEQYADSVLLHLGKEFEKYSKGKVLYGQELYSVLTKEKAKENGIETYNLFLDNDDFPKLALPKYSLNFFDMSDESTPDDLFSSRDLFKYRPAIKKICEILKVDGIVISYTEVITYSVSIFGISGKRLLNGKLMFFDKEGHYICRGDITSEKSGRAKPNSINNYKNVFFEYYNLVDLFLKKLYTKE